MSGVGAVKEIPPGQERSDLVGAIKYCPLCGSRDLSRGTGILVCGGCGHRDFNNPITAVAVFISDARGRVLLLRRAREPEIGKWVPPGGFLDAGETLEGAAARETVEETGLFPSDLRYLCSYPNYYIYRGFGRPVCDAFFAARIDSGNVDLQREEASEYRWILPQEIDPRKLAFESMRFALKSFLSK